jgi:hypothetical protein
VDILAYVSELNTGVCDSLFRDMPGHSKAICPRFVHLSKADDALNGRQDATSESAVTRA